MTNLLAILSLLGFAASNALETALMTLSPSQEKKLLQTFQKNKFPLFMVKWCRTAFSDWKRHPLPFLMAILIFNAAFSMLWCLVGIQWMGFAAWAPLVVGLILFMAGELVPKVWARRFPETILLLILLPFYFLFRFTRGLFAPLADYFERMKHWKTPAWLHYPMTEREVKHLLADPELTQDLRPRSRLVLEAMLDFTHRRVREAMRPSSQVFFVSLKEKDLQGMLRRILDSGYSRIPVSSDDTLDHVVGILYIKDLLFTVATSGLVNLQDILRTCPFVEEGQALGPIMVRFREGGIHIALVKNRQGRVTGIISLENILEEFVGEIQDEFSPV